MPKRMRLDGSGIEAKLIVADGGPNLGSATPS
jgi:hypothetical protein